MTYRGPRGWSLLVREAQCLRSDRIVKPAAVVARRRKLLLLIIIFKIILAHHRLRSHTIEGRHDHMTVVWFVLLRLVAYIA